MKDKIFKDSVHGYISIPDNYCEEIINTDIFQRLRHIEQTSVRVIYPSAHHDRFSHSLGVYHLGNMAFAYLKNNTLKSNFSLPLSKWDHYKNTFLSACLLHDCAHAPFSHTFEFCYEMKKTENENGEKVSYLDYELKKLFGEDYSTYCTPQTHEKASAIILIKKYSNAIKRLGGDPNLAARMIIGCQHSSPQSKNERFENCLIQLLNSKAIDVDKLDYISRDTWATGVCNVNIDNNRLLSAVTISNLDGKPILSFNKSALSVLHSVIYGRNFLYRWLYIHHKVLYDQYLLTEAIKKIAILMGYDEKELFSQIFSIDSLLEPINIKNFIFYLPTDGDLIYLLKSNIDKIPEAKELITRNHKNKALWKTQAEFELLFKDINDRRRGIIYKEGKEHLDVYGKKMGWKEPFLFLKAEAKLTKLERDEIFINIDNKTISYSNPAFSKDEQLTIPQYFFVYGPKECIKEKEECIRKLRNIV